jgi:hypothetical protein
MKNPINMTPQELIENKFDGPLKPCVTKLSGKQIFGWSNIGKLKPTNAITMRGKPVFLNEKGQLVYCEAKMAKRIEERLNQLKMGE